MFAGLRRIGLAFGRGHLVELVGNVKVAMGGSSFSSKTGLLRELGPSVRAGKMPAADQMHRIVTAQPSQGLPRKRGADDQRTEEKWNAQLLGTAEDTHKAGEDQGKYQVQKISGSRLDTMRCRRNGSGIHLAFCNNFQPDPTGSPPADPWQSVGRSPLLPDDSPYRCPARLRKARPPRAMPANGIRPQAQESVTGLHSSSLGIQRKTGMV